MAGTTTTSRDNAGHVQGALRDLLLQFNKIVTDLGVVCSSIVGTGVLVPTALSRGTTVTLAASASTISIAGVPAAVGALTAQAFGALGTIPADKWGLIAVERVANGTTTFVSAAANYTTGYATEAAAIAALPAITAGKVRVGYLTILTGAATPWVAGTDALAGGTGGTPATTTNYYNDPSMVGTAAQTAAKIGDASGVAITS